MILCPFRLHHQTLWTMSTLMGKMAFERDECFAKVVCMIELGVLSMKTHVRTTTWPPRLHRQTLWTISILMGKTTFERDECFAKVVCIMELDVTSIKTLVEWPGCWLANTPTDTGCWLVNWCLVIGQLFVNFCWSWLLICLLISSSTD